jgi:hypothetical protein
MDEQMKGPVKLGFILDSAFSQLGLSSKIKEYRIRKNWAAVVGKPLSRKTTPFRLKGKTIHISAENSAWLSEARYHKKEIIRRINEMTAEELVTEAVFSIGKGNEKEIEKPAEPPKDRALTREEELYIEKTVSAVKDAELKDRIKRALRRYKGRA